MFNIRTITVYDKFNTVIESAKIVIDDATSYEFSIVDILNETEGTSEKKVELKAVSELESDGIKLTLTKNEIKEFTLLLNQMAISLQNQ